MLFGEDWLSVIQHIGDIFQVIPSTTLSTLLDKYQRHSASKGQSPANPLGND